MLPIDKDTKLSQLFQLKKSLEQPGQEFWEHFDAQLRRKFLEQEVKISLWERWCNILQKYRVYIHSFAYTAACCALFLGALQFKSSKVAIPSMPHMGRIADDIVVLNRSWTDATLAFDVPKEQSTHYICNNIHMSGLNSRTKELVF
ncbi:MAG: hypothetical protein LBQ03_00865 [Puniceicoccales bacterium]|jgi:hypothetical protein|nr:hypothetical protein [Puniceicoccales bacterium]